MVVGDIPKRNENARRPTPNDDSEDWYTVIYEFELEGSRHSGPYWDAQHARINPHAHVLNKKGKTSHYCQLKNTLECTPVA